jgi:hypothetical protein
MVNSLCGERMTDDSFMVFDDVMPVDVNTFMVAHACDVRCIINMLL